MGGPPKLANLRAAIDDHRAAHLAWTDPRGPGSASALAASATGDDWTIAAALEILEDIRDGALDACRFGPGVRIGGSPTGTSCTGRITLSAEQLQINRRIDQQAVLRPDRPIERIEGGLRAVDFRAAGLRAEDLRQGG